MRRIDQGWLEARLEDRPGSRLWDRLRLEDRLWNRLGVRLWYRARLWGRLKVRLGSNIHYPLSREEQREASRQLRQTQM